jgi:hypothetical protein
MLDSSTLKSSTRNSSPTRPPKSSLLVAVVAAALLLNASPAEASKVRYRAVSLAKAVKGAQLVVVAHWAKPFVSRRPLPMKARAGQPKPAPFPQRLRHFRIDRVLRDRSTPGAKSSLVGKGSAGFKRGQTIAVADCNWRLWRSMRQASLLGQPVPSPIVARYPKGLSLDPKSVVVATKRREARRTRLILLLMRDGKGALRFAVRRGVLPKSARARVEALLRSR